MKTTTWRPDTCVCVLSYDWDETLPQTLRVHTASAILASCPEHAAVLVPSLRLPIVQEENSRKNRFHAALMTQLTTAVTTDPNGEIVLRGSRQVSYAFDLARVLLVTLTDFTTNERNTITTYAAVNFPGTVRII